MSYFVTGATGFIGRFLVAELLRRREGDVHVLVRRTSLPRFERYAAEWGSDRVHPVVGSLDEEGLGVEADWVAQHAGTVDHFLHLAASYDMAASAATNDRLNLGGTRHALELAAALDAGCFHQVSSVAAAGDHHGPFRETDVDVGQRFSSPYHRTKFESERIVRETASVPWRIYRPSVVVGHSRTGEMDKVDGPYYFLPMIRRLRDTLPGWTPLLGVDLGDTNVVPVDFVAAALDHLAHLPGRDGETFHLVDPEPQPVLEMVNALCAAAGAPRFAGSATTGRPSLGRLLPRGLRPADVAATVLGTPVAQAVLERTVGRLGLPASVLAHTSFPSVFDATRTTRALAGSGITVPRFESYAATLWTYWEEHLDDHVGRSRSARAALGGRHVVITGASSGIGRVTALKVAQAGGVPVLVARGREKLDALRRDIERAGGTAHVYPCDLSDLTAIDDLCGALIRDLPGVDAVVNNAGRSIRRSLRLSQDRFHDFERTMQLNYFGAIRLVIGLVPVLRQGDGGHVVNISSIGVQTHPPRFSAYVASKAALDAWSTVVASELVGEGVTFTNVHMPLVRTPMIAPTKLYDRFPTISPAQAADLVVTALVERPHEVNTPLGNAGAVAHTLAPKLAFRVLNMAYHVFPDSAAARGPAAGTAGGEGGGKGGEGGSQSEQLMLARVFRGVHW
ncbi:SDR family oxidoreductase [Nocardioides sp. ChNu-153]|uniref:SDR family oxidoreductase n=1 Tax=Nocardioides sp. ChNu-153 TaxID=2779364 RepID=UPI00264C73E6|nr:SDR family oxidoreductase [Nocardioides sp. ChNu-153]MDN7121210.1 SDR family oxidoreductase [Nocardioides sp. ChNu-153]